MVSQAFEIEVFFDGGCPLCRREIEMIRRKDKARLIRFTDIDEPSFNAPSVGKTQEELMAQLHGRLPDGTWVKGVDTFRRLYEAIGFRWIVRLSRLSGISQILNIAYGAFAKNRLALTGRCQSKLCRMPTSRIESLQR